MKPSHFHRSDLLSRLTPSSPRPSAPPPAASNVHRTCRNVPRRPGWWSGTTDPALLPPRPGSPPRPIARQTTQLPHPPSTDHICSDRVPARPGPVARRRIPAAPPQMTAAWFETIPCTHARHEIPRRNCDLAPTEIQPYRCGEQLGLQLIQPIVAAAGRPLQCQHPPVTTPRTLTVSHLSLR